LASPDDGEAMLHSRSGPFGIDHADDDARRLLVFVGIARVILEQALAESRRSCSACGAAGSSGRSRQIGTVRLQGRAPLQRPTQAPMSRASRRQDHDRPWRQSAALIQRAAAHRDQANGPQFAGRFGWPICGAKSLRPALQEIRIVARNNAGRDLNRPTLPGRVFARQPCIHVSSS
jgi:hypothetical protein